MQTAERADVETFVATLTDRLTSMSARLLDIRSSGFSHSSMNNRPIIAVDIRPEFRGLPDFDEDDQVLYGVEKMSGGAFSWARTIDGTDAQGERTINWFMVNPHEAWLACDAVAEFPVITDDQRESARRSLAAA